VLCRHCERRIILEDGRWVDPNATGDDAIWRECCDEHDTFEAEHEPGEPEDPTEHEIGERAFSWAQDCNPWESNDPEDVRAFLEPLGFLETAPGKPMREYAPEWKDDAR
jgi:hypothetical protein